MSECQISDPSLRELLPCKFTDSGGVQCERMDFHTEAGHRISGHTIQHSISGNAWDCTAFNEPVDTAAYRLRLRRQIKELTEELKSLEG